MATLAATATLLNKQKPMAAWNRAWCPGGRTRQKACVSSPRTSRSAASQTAPTASKATSYEAGLTTVSTSTSPRQSGPGSRSGRCTGTSGREPAAGATRVATRASDTAGAGRLGLIARESGESALPPRGGAPYHGRGNADRCRVTSCVRVSSAAIPLRRAAITTRHRDSKALQDRSLGASQTTPFGGRELADTT